MNFVYTRGLQKRKIYLKKKDPSLCPTDLHAAPQHSIKKNKKQKPQLIMFYVVTQHFQFCGTESFGS